MIENSLALVVATACLVLLLRLFMPERYRWRLDAMAGRTWRILRDGFLRIWHWRRSRQSAARMADEAIQRARRDVQRDGNVYRPKSFRDPRDSGDPRKPH